jgi:hypothetical protein
LPFLVYNASRAPGYPFFHVAWKKWQPGVNGKSARRLKKEALAVSQIRAFTRTAVAALKHKDLL